MASNFQQVFVDEVQALIDAYDAAAPDRVQAREEIRGYFETGTRPIVDAALRMALEKIGLTVEGPVNEVTITQAINDGPLAGTGIELTNAFDKDAIRRALERVAIRKVCEQFGVEADSIEGIKGALVDRFADVVGEQLANEAGDIFDAAIPAPQIAKIIKSAARKDGWNTPTDFTPKGISNRERQARFRANNTRVWVER